MATNKALQSSVKVPGPLAQELSMAPRRLPILGHAVALRRTPLDFLSSLPALGDLVKIGLGTRTAYLVCDPELSHLVLRDSRTFDKGGPVMDTARTLLRDGMVTCPYEPHRRQRRLIQPSFNKDRLAEYADMMPPYISAALDSWQDGQVIDVLPEMMEITSRVTARTMFTATLDADTISEFMDCLGIVLDGLFKRVTSPLPVLMKLPTPANRRYAQARARMDEIVQQTIEFYRRSGIQRGDLLATLLAARGEDGDRLSEQEIHDQVFTFFAAGTETTATLLAWALHVVGTQPHIRKQLQAEVDTVLDGRPATWADIPRLDFTYRILIETMRLYPPVVLTTRITTADTELGGHKIANGTDVFLSPYIVHRRPEIYPDPDTFNPDRWLSQRPAPPRGAYIPFGGGSRKCIGDTFSLTEATLALSTIVNRFELHPDPKSTTQPRLSSTLRPHPLLMSLHARRDQGR
ncbi:cytochrome P450 [Streptomyces sp. NBC_01077]|uniref:cytochrome P450 n=1 Tax=Streptomyces sp. NBC_01077 TaxID=2903746 RepID=UPI00386638E4|nr:cytochrome P450 [Streptomyces sp. NBC_01077]WSV43755.1 cytochrome P450 [Streptomyces sp. NBC_01077]